MTFSKEKPKEPGWYFMECQAPWGKKKELKIFVVEVIEVSDGLLRMALGGGEEIETTESKTTPHRFAGPIRLPKNRKAKS